MLMNSEIAGSMHQRMLLPSVQNATLKFTMARPEKNSITEFGRSSRQKLNQISRFKYKS
jgi:hypothetical protein